MVQVDLDVLQANNVVAQTLAESLDKPTAQGGGLPSDSASAAATNCEGAGLLEQFSISEWSDSN